MRLLLAFILLGLTPFAASAQDCGGEGAPCVMPEGVYHISMPSDAATGAIVWLHGYGGRAEAVIRNRGLMENMHAAGYAVVAVQGMPRFDGDRGGSWNSIARPAPRRDDVAFIGAVADDAARRLDLPRERFLLAGFSGGGMMTWRVACDAPDSFAAFLPIAGTFWEPAPNDCEAPALLHHTHGWTDGVVPLEGRTVGSGITQGNIFAIMAQMRGTMGCTSRPAGEMVQNADTLYRGWDECPAGRALALTLHPGGHAIPRGWVGHMDAWLRTRL